MIFHLTTNKLLKLNKKANVEANESWSITASWISKKLSLLDFLFTTRDEFLFLTKDCNSLYKINSIEESIAG